MTDIPKVLFSSKNRFEAGEFKIFWEFHEPTLPVKIVEESGEWKVIPDVGATA